MKYQVAVLTALLIGTVLSEKKKPDFEETYRSMPKADLRKYVKIFETEVKAIPGIDLSDCNSLKHSKVIDPKNREEFRFCVYYINLKGIAEGKPPKGLAWPVKGANKASLDEDGYWGILSMYDSGLLKKWKPKEELNLGYLPTA